MSVVSCSLQGQPLELHEFDGKHFRFVSPAAKAPGQPLMITAQLATPVTLDLKSIGSVRRPDGRFDVRARAATLHRDARRALLAHFERA